MHVAANKPEQLSFGPFTLKPAERVLLRGETIIELGGRGMDVLIALVSRANEVVSKKQLLADVWPGVIVEEVSLRFHISGLRSVLGDGVAGARYIATIAGRGYCFVAPVRRSVEDAPDDIRAAPQRVNLPSRLHRILGRVKDMQRLDNQLSTDRFVTIVGSGGIGKTTVAVAVGHRVLEKFSGAVVFVDLGAVYDRSLIAATIASVLGMSVHSADTVEGLTAQLRDKRLLLILDTCEHLLEAAGPLASHLFSACPRVHILATSREAMRVEGENVHRLDALAFPPEDADLTAAETKTFTSAQLFMERARAGGARLDWDEPTARLVAHICRKLGGVPLAIELAAGRVGAYGIERTAATLDQRLSLLWPGQRTAPARQQSLEATLNWSYELLTGIERTVLRRLTIFVGLFTFEAALEVLPGNETEEKDVFRALESLIDKSLLATYPMGAMMRYRLLDTTRAYAAQIRSEDSERNPLAARHASYYQKWLENHGTEWSRLSNAAERAPHLAALGNVRAALEWSFGPQGSIALAIPLAAAAAPVMLAMSLLTECDRWVGVALAALDDTRSGGPDEMRLQTAKGMSLMFTRNHSDDARVAFERSLDIAKARRDTDKQLLLFAPLHMFHFRCGQYHRALMYATCSAEVASETGDPSAVALAHCLTGISLHSMGELDTAREELEATLRHEPTLQRQRTIQLGFDYYNWAGMALARTLWMQGHFAEAMARVQRTLDDAERLDHRVTLTLVLHWAAAVCLWHGDLQKAEAHIDRFLARAEAHSLAPYLAVGLGLRGELAIRRGNPQGGVVMLESALETLHAARYELVSTAFNVMLAQGLHATGQLGKAAKLVETAIRLVEENGDRALMPELLRVKGQILLSMSPSDYVQGEAVLLQSMEWSRQHSARAWELRAAIDLAASWLATGRAEQVLATLEPIVDAFSTEPPTLDLNTAQRVLTAARDDLSARAAL